MKGNSNFFVKIEFQVVNLWPILSVYFSGPYSDVLITY